MTAPARLATAIAQGHQNLADAMFTQAVVTSFTDTEVSVTVAGAPITVGKIASYTPAVGDVVWLAGPPGSWFALGALGASQAPICEYEVTANITGFATGVYYQMASGMTQVADNDGMFSSSFSFYRVVIPTEGRWGVEWHWVSTATTGTGNAAVTLNVPNGTDGGTAVSQYSIMADNETASALGCLVHVNETRLFNAGDALSFVFSGSAAYAMNPNFQGGLNSRFVVRYIGPN